MSIRVTYILPTCNRPKFLDESLQRAQKLVGKKDELIVVDGSEGEESAKVVAKYPHVTEYIHIKNQGEAYGVNQGLVRAHGEFIKEISDDDIIYPEGMRLALNYLMLHPEVDALQCGGEAYEQVKHGEVKLLYCQQVPKNRNIGKDYGALLCHVPCGLGLILRRRILPKVGLFDTSYLAVDINYMARIILAKCNYQYFDVCLYRHIKYPHSGEQADFRTHADRARVHLLLSEWDGALNYKTVPVAAALGIGTSPSEVGFLWVVKVLNLFRHTIVGRMFFVSAGWVINAVRDMFIVFRTKTAKHIESHKEVKWSGKAW